MDNEKVTAKDISLRDYFASQAMLAVMGETQEMKIASFWDWVKHLLLVYLNMGFLSVKYIEIEGVYEDASKRAYAYADEMMKQAEAFNNYKPQEK